MKHYPPPADAWIHYGGEGKTYRDHIAAGENPIALRRAWSKQHHAKKKNAKHLAKLPGGNRDMCSIEAYSGAFVADTFRGLGVEEKRLEAEIMRGKDCGTDTTLLEEALGLVRAKRLKLVKENLTQLLPAKVEQFRVDTLGFGAPATPITADMISCVDTPADPTAYVLNKYARTTAAEVLALPLPPLPGPVGIRPQVLADAIDWAKGDDHSAAVVVEIAPEVPGAEKIEEPQAPRVVTRKFKSSRRKL